MKPHSRKVVNAVARINQQLSRHNQYLLETAHKLEESEATLQGQKDLTVEYYKELKALKTKIRKYYSLLPDAHIPRFKKTFKSILTQTDYEQDYYYPV